MRGEQGPVWLDRLSSTVGKRVYCAADFVVHPRQMLEATRLRSYKENPLPANWHADYVVGKVGLDGFS